MIEFTPADYPDITLEIDYLPSEGPGIPTFAQIVDLKIHDERVSSLLFEDLLEHLGDKWLEELHRKARRKDFENIRHFRPETHSFH